jgi:hypothetical protein
MKFWLLITLLDFQGNFVGKVQQGPYVDKPACIAAAKMTGPVKGDPPAKTLCLSDDHMKGKRIDPGITALD